MKKCSECGVELKGKLKVLVYAGYCRKNCRIFTNKIAKKKQREKAKIKKEWSW